MTNSIRCGECGAERTTAEPCPCALATIEDVFGPMPYLKVPPSTSSSAVRRTSSGKHARPLEGFEGVLRAHTVDFRKAFMHDNWDGVLKLGGARRAYAWAHSLEGLVNLCVKSGPVASALFQIGGQSWPWPAE